MRANHQQVQLTQSRITFSFAVLRRKKSMGRTGDNPVKTVIGASPPSVLDGERLNIVCISGNISICPFFGVHVVFCENFLRYRAN